MGAGVGLEDALEVANAAAAVTVRKLRQTGTASPREIADVLADCSYNHNLDLAREHRKTRYAGDSEVELVEGFPPGLDLRHAIIDHDGTISTLRQGWEQVMLPVMMRSICGPDLDTITAADHDRLAAKCSDFINATTGIQTIVQMWGLRDMVLEEGYVAPSKVKSAARYKAIYLEELMTTVRDRLRRLQSGELGIADCTLLGALELIDSLADRNIPLHLVSGTDQEDVQREAEALGYAERFDGGIHGSQGDEPGDAKRVVLTQIIGQRDGLGRHLVVIGDGPVEMLEGRRAGALCVGVASDEIRRHGLNRAKRSRLVRAGAHIIVPDFSRLEPLLKTIFPGN